MTTVLENWKPERITDEPILEEYSQCLEDNISANACVHI